jgi:hypothetical protein
MAPNTPTPTHAGVERRRLAVAGADAVLADLAAGIASGTPAGLAAARALAGHRVDWTAVRADIVASAHAIVLAGDERGPVLGARFFAPDRPTAIHDHGCAGAAVVVEGRQRYERFERDERYERDERDERFGRDVPAGPGSTHLESAHDLAAGDVVWWGEPPDDVHRQRAAGAGAIELVLLCGEVVEPSTFTEADAAGPGSAPGDLRRAVVEGFWAGDIAVLRPWYHDDALIDVNVPNWRFQVRGGGAGLQLLHDDEFAQPDRRLAFVRVTDTAAGVLLETETRFRDRADGRPRATREVHQLRLRDGLVAEHVVWCTGINDPETIRRQFDTAPMERM